MKLETCVYSGYKIYPGHGKRVVRPDGKGSYGQEHVQKKKVKKVATTLNRAVAGMSLEAILAKRNQTSDFRRQQREQAAKAAKEANKAARAAKAAMNKEKKPVPQKMKPPKPVKAAAPRVGGKR
ncbi:putative ribosomal protein L24e [Ancylostoma ceylanicum]|uniref:Putative ribosomal protein L24e n=1 Tax=Ancylostoma ceylanicum TaxID=53326 RepID=A0A0D6LHY9_9BILA|nr:putative ribosomal protein L24e [Ancylostoma ceylanicum]